MVNDVIDRAMQVHGAEGICRSSFLPLPWNITDRPNVMQRTPLSPLSGLESERSDTPTDRMRSTSLKSVRPN